MQRDQSTGLGTHRSIGQDRTRCDWTRSRNLACHGLLCTSIPVLLVTSRAVFALLRAV